MNKMFKVVTVVFMGLFSLQMQAQSQQLLYGKIVDSKNGSEISFATVRIKDSKVGVIADEKGVFTIPASTINNYSKLIISCIGYQTTEVNLSVLKRGEVNLIVLEEAITALDEIVVKAIKKKLSAKQIVRRALKEIPNNYPEYPFSYVGYYRDYKKKQNDYFNLNEAIVEIHDGGFNTNDRQDSRIKLLEYKTDSSFKREPFLEVNYDNRGQKFIPNAVIHPSGGNELTILMTHDAIRNYKHLTYSFVYIMEKHLVKNHYFNLVKTTKANGENIYIIDFKLEQHASNEHKVSGQLYINKNTFAIHKFNYNLFRKKDKESMFKLQVEYSEKGGQMFLNYISFNNAFSVPDPKDFAVVNMTYNHYDGYLEITFNNAYALDNIKKLSNYKVKIDNKKLPLREVILNPLNKKEIKLALDLEEDRFPVLTESTRDWLKVDIANITDTEGRILGDISFLKYRQYRELFVQQVNMEGVKAYQNFIDKFLPLKDGEVVKSTESQSYWMNTPLKMD